MDRPKAESEVVRRFSDELNSVVDSKLPLSRAKMASITKLAIKNLKCFKHIVMIVEKFISKCHSDYKVPGLYVIDSIVRQSRHQFGPDKEIFGPRFAKKFPKTFRHLFQCSPADQAKVVRVLNLWQKNRVFGPDVIQPLLSLAPGSLSPSEQPEPTSSSAAVGNQALDLNSASAIIQQQQQQIQELLQQQQQLQSQANSLLGPALQGILNQATPQQPLPHQQSTGPPAPPQPPNEQADTISALLQQAQHLQQLQALQQQLGGNSVDAPGAPAVMSNMETGGQMTFNQALLDDFDYSDDEEDVEKRLAQQRERLHQQKTRLEERGPLPPSPEGDPGMLVGSVVPMPGEAVGGELPGSSSELEMLDKLQEQFQSRRQEMALSNARHDLPIPIPREERRLHENPQLARPPNPPLPPSYLPPVPPPMQHDLPPPPLPPSCLDNHHPPGPPPPRDWGHPPLPPPHYPPRRSPSPPRMRGRFHSPPPHHRGRSPSPPHARRHWRDRDRWSPRRRSRSPPRRHSRDRSRSPRRRMSPPPLSAADRDRQRKGIPLGKDKHMTVCSRTIWMGHLAKSVSQEQVVQAFEDFGQVKSVELIQARGCAYVVMFHRSDAMRALTSLRDLKINGNTCKLSWAPGRGVKGMAFKSYWDHDQGASFIPWEKLRTEKELADVTEGGWIDPLTCPPGMKPPPPTEEAKETPVTSSTDTLKPDQLPQQQAPPTPLQPKAPPRTIPTLAQQSHTSASFSTLPSAPHTPHTPLVTGPPPIVAHPIPSFTTQPSSHRPPPIPALLPQQTFAGHSSTNGPPPVFSAPQPRPPMLPPGPGPIPHAPGGSLLPSFSTRQPPPSSLTPPGYAAGPPLPANHPLFPPPHIPPHHVIPQPQLMPPRHMLPQNEPPHLIPPQQLPPQPQMPLAHDGRPVPSGPPLLPFPPVSMATHPPPIHLPPHSGPSPSGPPPPFPPSDWPLPPSTQESAPQAPPSDQPSSPSPSSAPPPSSGAPPSATPHTEGSSEPTASVTTPPDPAPTQEPEPIVPETVSTNDDMQIDDSPPPEDV